MYTVIHAFEVTFLLIFIQKTYGIIPEKTSYYNAILKCKFKRIVRGNYSQFYNLTDKLYLFVANGTVAVSEYINKLIKTK